MVKLKHPTLIFISGFVWLVIGIGLLSLGIQFILQPPLSKGFSVLQVLLRFAEDRYQATVILLTICLLIGFFKGRFMLTKSANRQINRIRALPNPSPIRYIYGKGYYLLIGCMISLGICMRLLPISLDTRGAIDAVIGAALINGSALYFRNLRQPGIMKP